MQASGNMHQWTDGYPSEAVILSDMEKGGGYVDSNIRIDTHLDNRIMQHVIKKYGFTYCGIIYLAGVLSTRCHLYIGPPKGEENKSPLKSSGFRFY